MIQTIKKYILYAILAAIGYFFLDNHIIYCGTGINSFRLLKKSELSLEYTFYSIKSKKIDSIMRIDSLREDGIGDLLVKLGKISEAKKNKLEEKYGIEYEYEEEED